KGVKIYVDTNHNQDTWEEIDSVKLLGLYEVQSGGSTTVAGTLDSRKVDIQAGSLGGTGTVVGDLANAGQVSPGAPTGVLTISGNYTQAAAGTLAINLGSLTQFGQLVVGGTAAIDGTLAVSLLGGYVPNSGDTFSILHTTSPGSVAGIFAQLVGM